MRIADPEREAVGAGGRGLVELRYGRDIRQSENSNLRPGDQECEEYQNDDASDKQRLYPDPKTPIAWVVNCPVKCIKLDRMSSCAVIKRSTLFPALSRSRTFTR